jgi:hypothetical protein
MGDPKQALGLSHEAQGYHRKAYEYFEKLVKIDHSAKQTREYLLGKLSE